MTSQRFTISAAPALCVGIAQEKADYSPYLAERDGSGADVSGRVVIASEWSADLSARISERGVSLAELILNLAIVMILATMSLPLDRRVPSRRALNLLQFAGNSRGLLRYAHR
jgi:hypothetical protein